MKKVKVIFADGSVGEVNDTDVQAVLTSGGKLYVDAGGNLQSEKTTVKFKDGSEGEINSSDLEKALSSGATLVKKKEEESYPLLLKGQKGQLLLDLRKSTNGTISTVPSQSILEESGILDESTPAIEDFNKQFEDFTGHVEFSLSEPAKPKGLLSNDYYEKKKKQFEQKKFTTYQSEKEKIRIYPLRGSD